MVDQTVFWTSVCMERWRIVNMHNCITKPKDKGISREVFVKMKWIKYGTFYVRKRGVTWIDRYFACDTVI